MEYNFQDLEVTGRTLFEFQNEKEQNGFITHPTTITITTNTTRIIGGDGKVINAQGQ